MREPSLTHPSAAVFLGDCLDVLAEMPDASVDSIVCDPPYGLGFMGKDWDDIPPGLPWAQECLRVLKPGGHLLAFGGTRTWHRLAVAVEDAGFEVRDSIAWLYGCHDDQTEVLTRRGWVNGLELTEDDDVAQWATDGTVSLVRPSALQRYPFDGRMVRFRNADADQLVTPNHRVYRQVSERSQVEGVRVSSWSDWQVDQAADVNRWQRMRLPAAGIHDGPGIGGTDYAALLGWVWADGGFDLSGSGVRVYQSSTNQPYVDEIAALLDRAGPHKRYDYARTWKGAPYTMTTWYMSGDLARQIRADLPGKAPTWDLLWKMTADEKRALWDAAMKGDGSKARRTFWQKDRASLEWVQALLAGIGHRGKIADDPRGALHWSDRPTVELQARHLADDGENYTGEVWCVTVPSGAFIVRRNGRVSVSGNSGFPKSLDVSKAIDKAAGATREVVGHADRKASLGSTGVLGASNFGEVPVITAPATPAAQQWQGWGTALKPAFEPIVVARKPLIGTVAANVLAHGTGALNIDATRVTPTGESRPRVDEPSQERRYTDAGGTNFAATPGVRGGAPEGRWPANVLLDGDMADALDEQSGNRPGFSGGGATPGEVRNDVYGDGWQRNPNPATYNDQGGASRFFPTFRYQAKAPTRERPTVVAEDGTKTAHPTVKPLALMRWLVRLVTPPGGTVLDPFAGSGATVEAAIQEGFFAMGIEREADYLPLIQVRLDRVEAPASAPAADATEGTEDAKPAGRWPTNVLIGTSQVPELDDQSGITKSSGGSGDKSGKLAANVYGDYAGTTKGANAGGLGDQGGASRFFPQFDDKEAAE